MALKSEGLTERIIGAAIEVHRCLGPGLLESAYRRCLEHELKLCGLTVRSEMLLDINYKGLHVQSSYRLDLLVEESVIVEVKSVRLLQDIHKAQLLTYLRLHGAHVGLLLNFNVPLLRDGIQRVVL